VAAEARKAVSAHYRMFPVIGAPISLDEPAFGDGPPLIERITTSLWD
jgi:hypothetical protein